MISIYTTVRDSDASGSQTDSYKLINKIECIKPFKMFLELVESRSIQKTQAEMARFI